MLFDIGGVLVALDGVPSLARLLGLEEDHDALHSMWMKSPSVVAHETGKIEAVGFQQEGTLAFQNLSPLTCPPA